MTQSSTVGGRSRVLSAPTMAATSAALSWYDCFLSTQPCWPASSQCIVSTCAWGTYALPCLPSLSPRWAYVRKSSQVGDRSNGFVNLFYLPQSQRELAQTKCELRHRQAFPRISTTSSGSETCLLLLENWKDAVAVVHDQLGLRDRLGAVDQSIVCCEPNVLLSAQPFVLGTTACIILENILIEYTGTSACRNDGT